MDSTFSTCGMGRSSFSTRSITLRVRATEAPSGNCTDDEERALVFFRQEPGRRLAPRRRSRAAQATITTSDSTATRNSRVTSQA